MFLRMVTCWLGCRPEGSAAARAFRTDPSWIAPAAARPPTARPERRRNVRRSSASAARPAATPCNLARLASPLFLLINMAASLLKGLVAVGAVEGLDVVGLAVAALALLPARIVGLRLGRRDRRGARGRNRRGATQRAQEAAAVQPFVVSFAFHASLREVEAASSRPACRFCGRRGNARVDRTGRVRRAPAIPSPNRLQAAGRSSIAKA